MKVLIELIVSFASTVALGWSPTFPADLYFQPALPDRWHGSHITWCFKLTTVSSCRTLPLPLSSAS